MNFYKKVNGQRVKMSKAEIKQIEDIRQAKEQTNIEAEAAKEAAKAAALTKLEALGLTLEDLKALGL